MSIANKVYGSKEEALQAVAESVGVYLRDEPDVPQLRKLQDWVFEQAKHPINERAWVQGDWISFKDEWQRLVTYKDLDCGTTCCVAGMQGLLDGLHLNDVGDITDSAGSNVMYLETQSPFESKFTLDLAVADWAERRLGLNATQAAQLFSGSNNENSIKKAITSIVGEEL